MRTSLALLGVLALTCAGLVVASGDPPSQAQSQGATAKSGDTPGSASKPASAADPASDPKEAEIRSQLAELGKAYNAPDVDAMVKLFTDDAVVVDPSGAETRGKQAIGDMYAEEFAEVSDLKLEAKVDEIRFLTPEVARVEGRSRLSTGTGDANEYTRFSVLMLRRDGKWLVNEVREYPAPVADITPYERLQELEWMVGDWVDEGNGNKISSSIRWADNDSFLIRTYHVEIEGEKVSSGTMFIGWDPQNSQIKSWVFSSEGGHGEGLWTRTAENQWIVKAQGVRHDGMPNSATQIHTILNKDVVKTSSIDRIIGGQVAPDIADVVMVRKAPAPAAQPQPKPAEDAKSEQ